MFAGGAASQKEVHLSLEIHSEVDEGVCIEDMTLLHGSVKIITLSTFSTKIYNNNRHKIIMLEQYRYVQISKQ